MSGTQAIADAQNVRAERIAELAAEFHDELGIPPGLTDMACACRNIADMLQIFASDGYNADNDIWRGVNVKRIRIPNPERLRNLADILDTWGEH